MSEVKLKLSAYMDSLVSEIAKATERSKTATVEALLFRVEVYAKHGKFTEAFGLEWIEQMTILNAQGHGAKHADPVQLAGGEHVDFDVSLLETSAKSRTGFAGVHATTGNSFRALVPDVEAGGGTRYLTSRKTALQAAIDRFNHYEKYGLPYGAIGWHVEEQRKRNPKITVEQALLNVREFLADGHTFGMKNPIALEDLDRALARHREVNGIETKVIIEDERPRSEPIEVTAKCNVCEQEIEDGEPFGPHGDGYSHSSCV